MITYDNGKGSRLMVLAGVAVAVVAAGVWWWSGNSASVDATGGSESTSALPWQAASGDAMTAPRETTHQMETLSRGDVSDADWETLNAVLAKQGGNKADADRIVSFLGYQNAFERWQSLNEPGDAVQRRQAAQALMNELPDRFSSGQFTHFEAALMGAVLIAELEGDESKRDEQLLSWQARLHDIRPFPNDQSRGHMDAATELMRRQATAFEQWRTQSDALERSPAKLEQAFEAARREINSAGR